MKIELQSMMLILLLSLIALCVVSLSCAEDSSGDKGITGDDDDDDDDDDDNDDGDDDDNDDDDDSTTIEPPDNLSAQVLNAYKILLAWTDNSGNEDGFNVYRDDGVGAEFALIASVSENIDFFVDNSAFPDNEYTYTVTAFNTDGESATSNKATASTTIQWEKLDAGEGIYSGSRFLPFGADHFFYIKADGYNNSLFEYQDGEVNEVSQSCPAEASSWNHTLHPDRILCTVHFQGPAGNRVYEYNGEEWTLLYSNDDNGGIALFPIGEIIFASYSGDLLRYNGASWSEWAELTGLNLSWLGPISETSFCFQDRETDEYVIYVDGHEQARYSSPNPDWYLGTRIGGSFYTYNAETKQIYVFDPEAGVVSYPANTSANIRAFWGTSETDAFGVGSYGTIIHSDGSEWSIQPTPRSDDLYDVWGSSQDNVFAVGAFGTILQYDGAVWSLMLTDTLRTFSVVDGIDSDSVFAVGGSVYAKLP